MRTDKLVKVFSLNLERNKNKEKGKDGKWIPTHESDISQTSSDSDIKSRSLSNLSSVKSGASTSQGTITSEQLNPFKRTNSLSENVFKFKKLLEEGTSTSLESNIFRKFNANRRREDLFLYSHANSNVSLELRLAQISRDGYKEKNKLHNSNEENSLKNHYSFGRYNGSFVPSQVYHNRRDNDISQQLKIEESPLSLHMNPACKPHTKQFTRDDCLSTFVKISREIKKTDIARDTREATRPAGKVEKKKIEYFLKRLSDYNEMIYGNKKNNGKKVKKSFYKNRKIIYKCIHISMFEKKKILKELTFNENKKLKINLINKNNYLHNTKYKKYFLQLFMNNNIFFFFKKKFNCVNIRRRNFFYLDKYVSSFLFKEFRKKWNKLFSREICMNTQNIVVRGYSLNRERINVFSMKRSDNFDQNDDNDRNNLGDCYHNGGDKSHIFFELGENVTMGKGNILFPGSKIVTPFGKVYIGNYNLLEDHVEIINNTTNDMYIGNYNIFRSGTYITDTLSIGHRNYFDYKCVISNSNVSCCSFVGSNLMMCRSWGNKENVQTSHNTVTDMHPIFVEVITYKK
ncbi:dynactin subunit 6, putative [Plasmodium ovale]|uniref:Dynactin subunit 6 n=1 Tax=Plasmodium ovale TaxID=36330 RepID=A0A1C3KP84_PLAOA|nr:dynactin subunit 6, putative [Plasmodium ovale]